MNLRDGTLSGETCGRSTLFVRGVAVASTAYLTIGFAWYLVTVGITSARLALAILALGAAWGGAAGTVLERPVLPLVGALALFLLGFWQAVLWIFMLPAALGLAVTAVVVAHLG